MFYDSGTYVTATIIKYNSVGNVTVAAKDAPTLQKRSGYPLHST